MFSIIKTIDLPGYNGCLYKNKDNKWIGTQRYDKEWRGDLRINKIIHYKLDKTFNIIKSEFLKDESNRTIYRSYTEGPEDARFIDENRLVAVTLDTNTYWKPQMSLFNIDLTTNSIKKVLPMKIIDIPLGIEKNWLFLKETETELIFLHHSFPFRIVNVNKETGEGYTSKYYEVPQFSFVAHNGSIVKLPEIYDNNYLLTIRIKEKHNYIYSIMCILDSEFNLIKISEPFKFISGTSCEMCMSMNIIEDKLICCVGIDDISTNIISADLYTIVNSCKSI